MKDSIAKQLTPHEPFPIADYVDGLKLDKEPWLSPRNAFRTLNNARIFRGRLWKRSGFSRFAETTVDTSDVTSSIAGAGDGNGYHVHTTAASLLARWIPESITFSSLNGTGSTITAEVDVGSERWYPENDFSLAKPWVTTGAQYEYFDNSWVWDIVETGTSTVLGYLAYREPDVFVALGIGQRMQAGLDWSLHSGYDASLADSDMLGRNTEEENLTGITNYTNTDGDFSLAFDENNLYSYDTAAAYYKVQGKAAAYSYFTGDDEDYFWTWPLTDYIVFTNNKDAVHRWDPGASASSSVTEMPTDWNGAGNELDTCLLVMRFKGRLCYLNTLESATRFPTRLRFTQAGSFTTWFSPLDYIDAPAEFGDIVTGEFIGERMFVGFEKGWMEVISTGDANVPLEWVPVISRFGAVSKLSTIKDNERLLSRSLTSMQAIDPNGQYYLDVDIPDLVLGFSSVDSQLSASFRNEQQRAFWWTYVPATATRPNKVLVSTYDEKSNLAWSQYDMTFNDFAEIQTSQSPSWNSLGPEAFNFYTSITWNEAIVNTSGFTQTIGASDNGIVYIFDSGTRDELVAGAANINMSVETQELAPYPGRRAHLGWIDVYADASPGTILTLTFYADKKSASYLSRQIDLTPNGVGGKVYRRIRVGRNAAFHRLKIDNSTQGSFGIDALVPYFRPGGRIRAFN